MKMEADSSKNFTLAGWLIAVFGLFSIIIIIGVYNFRFSGGLALTHQHFAEFGDYFGGVLNPILTALTIVLLVYSLRLQLHELRNSTTELRNSSHELKNNRITLEETRLVHEDNVRVQQLNVLIPIAVKRLDVYIVNTSKALEAQMTFHYSDKSEIDGFEDLLSFSISALEISRIYKYAKVDGRVQKLTQLIAEEGEAGAQRVLIAQVNNIFGFIDEIHIIISELQELECHSLVYFDYLRQLTSTFFRLRDIFELLDDVTRKGVNARFDKNSEMSSIVLKKYMLQSQGDETKNNN